MLSVDRVPQYVAEACAGAARLQEQTTPDQYAALVERATRLLEGLFSVDTNVDFHLQAKIALREKFDHHRVKQAILMVATWQLVNSLARAWDARPAQSPVRTRPAVVLSR
jgi:hypothetical protein